VNPRGLEHHVCPACRGGGLILHPDQAGEAGDVLEGHIACPGCGAGFPLTRGIPRFAPPHNYADTFGFQWNAHARTQLDSYSGLPISRRRLFDVTGWEPDLRGQRVLEAGSGAGRFTEILVETGATVLSFDYSSAVDANLANNGGARNLQLFQADILRVPLPEASFDKVVCLGVLQHTPEPEASFRSLARYVRPGGELVVDVYSRHLVSLLQWKYALRPLVRRLPREVLYRLVGRVTPPLIPVARLARRIGGRAGARLVPIVEYSHLGLPDRLNREWAVLDTFDMYSPVHDHPQSLASVRQWYEETGFVKVEVRYGPNGVVGRGTAARRASSNVGAGRCRHTEQPPHE
jgi:SAM-dependent methyltransferase